MRIAVLGSGGREHALCWKFAQSSQVEKVFAVPGNGGTENNIPIDPCDFKALKIFVEKENIGLIFVGPEQPLAEGIVDYFRNQPLRVFGPDRQAAQLESSKLFAKQFMKKYGVATADFWQPANRAEAEEIIKKTKGQVVLKYDGLAAGKGVYVCSHQEEARMALHNLYDSFGAEAPLYFEERFYGQEISLIGFTDGQDIKMLLPAQDHKAAFDGDKGPNTGGMGAYCPVPFCTPEMLAEIDREIVQPTLSGLQAEKFDYHGVIYFGVIQTESGPHLLEYNVRFGDPETEVLLPMLKSDLLDLTLAALENNLSGFKIEFNLGYAVDVVMAAAGYPGVYPKGMEISGLEKINANQMVFQAGTSRRDGRVVSSGGRVLNVVGHGSTLQEAIYETYAAVSGIRFDDAFFRRDIGRKGLPDE